MRYRITFVAGFAIGYVLGTKAGRQRYEQLARVARRVAENPAAQETAGVIGAQISSAGRAAWDKVADRLPVSSLHDFLDRPTPEEESALGERAPSPRHGVNGESSQP